MKTQRMIVAYALCVLGFFVSASWFYPGYQSFDAVVQSLQAQAFQFSDTHPPIMAFVWHYLMFLTPKGQSFSVLMFLLQLLLLWFALGLWVYLLAKRNCRYLWLIPLVGWFPSIVILNAFVWKDIQMGNSLLLALTLFVLLRQGVRSQYVKIVALLLMVLLVFYAFCLRHEAVFACVPVFYLWSGVFCRTKVFFKMLLTLGFTFVFALFSWLFSLSLHTHEDYPAQQVMFYDLASLSIEKNQMLIPLEDCRNAKTCFDELRRDYDPSSVLPISTDFTTGYPHPTWFMPFEKLNTKVVPLQWTYSAVQYEQLKLAWLQAIIKHPGLYLYERTRLFMASLAYVPFFYSIQFAALSHPSWLQAMPANFVARLFFAVYACLSVIFAFAFALWFWLCLNVVMLLFLRGHNDRAPVHDVVTTMLWSGLLLCLSHFIVAATYEFRFSYWIMLVTMFSCVVLFVGKSQGAWLDLLEIP